jgi:hypothetical protein
MVRADSCVSQWEWALPPELQQPPMHRARSSVIWAKGHLMGGRACNGPGLARVRGGVGRSKPYSNTPPCSQPGSPSGEEHTRAERRAHAGE